MTTTPVLPVALRRGLVAGGLATVLTCLGTPAATAAHAPAVHAPAAPSPTAPSPTAPSPTAPSPTAPSPTAPSPTASTPDAASPDPTRAAEYWLKEYGFDRAETVSRGAGVKVAVIDTGIADDHPDLTGAVVGGTDVSGTGAGGGDAPLGPEPEHATMVATLLAGRGHTATPTGEGTGTGTATPTPSASSAAGTAGIVGVAPDAQLLSVSAWVGDGNPGGKDIMDQIPEAVRWSVDHGARVINMSLTSTSPSWPRSWDEAFAYAEQKDVLVVAAAGNRSGGITQVGAPATIPGVLTVGGLDRDGKASWDASAQGISIGVSAPSEDLVGGLPDGGYRTWAGTSAATPLVAGLAALIRSRWPDLSAAETANRIISTARDEGAPGRDPIYGFGVVDAARALTADVPPAMSDPLGSITEWIRVHRRGTVTETPTPDAGASKGIVPNRTAQAVPVPAAPSPEPPTSDDDVLPGLIVIGSGVLFVALVAGAVIHLTALRRTGTGRRR